MGGRDLDPVAGFLRSGGTSGRAPPTAVREWGLRAEEFGGDVRSQPEAAEGAATPCTTVPAAREDLGSRRWGRGGPTGGVVRPLDSAPARARRLRGGR